MARAVRPGGRLDDAHAIPGPHMPHNVLLTGPPRSGKTTVIQRVRTRLEAAGYRAGGIICPERRAAGERVGFEIVDVLSGEARWLAHVDRESGPRVGKYRVDVENVDRISARALPRARREADFVVIDEIAPMEVHSEVFVREATATLTGAIPVLAAVHHRSTRGFIGAVKARDDIERFDIDERSRDTLPDRLTSLLRRRVDDRG